MTIRAGEAKTPGDKHWHSGEIVNHGEWRGDRAFAKEVGGKAGDIELALRQEMEMRIEREVGGERHIGVQMSCCHFAIQCDALFILLLA